MHTTFLNIKMKIYETHFTVQSSFTTKCVPSFHSKNANDDNDGSNKKMIKNKKIMDYNEK